MANDRTKKPGDSSAQSPASMTALERYLAKQKQEKAAQAAKDNPPPKVRKGLSKPPPPAAPVDPKAKPSVGYGPDERPSLANIQRPGPVEPPQPASLSRWESVAENRLSETEQRAREAGAPATPPPRESGFEFAPRTSSSPTDTIQPITNLSVFPDEAGNADFGPRFLAAIIDACILYSLSFVAQRMVLAVFAVAFGAVVEAHRDGLGYLVSLCVTYSYYGYFYPVKGASPGKLMLNLEVLDTDGVTRLTPWKAFLREAIGKAISAIPFFMGYVIILIRRDHRALHDLLFDTRVIKKPEMTR